MQITHSVLILQGPRGACLPGTESQMFSDSTQRLLQSWKRTVWSLGMMITGVCLNPTVLGLPEVFFFYNWERRRWEGGVNTAHSQTRSGGRFQLEVGKPGLNYRECHLQMS